MTEKVLLIDCPDEKGLIHKITGVLYNHDLNITSNNEFVDPVTDHFFMRTTFGDNGSTEVVERDFRNSLPPAANIRLVDLRRSPIVIMATKEPHCLGDLLLRDYNDELPSHISAVISNYDTLEPLVQAFNIPFHHVGHDGLERGEHEKGILKILEKYDPRYIVLAKYMRILTPEFVSRYSNRIINIHHSFLPAFTGSNPYKQAFKRGVKIIGATAHIVTEELDEGPIITQDTLPVNHSYTAKNMSQAGRDVETNVLAKALKLVLEERVFIYKNRTVVFN